MNFDHLVIDAKLGMGSFAYVYSAVDRISGHKYAIKLFKVVENPTKMIDHESTVLPELVDGVVRIHGTVELPAKVGSVMGLGRIASRAIVMDFIDGIGLYSVTKEIIDRLSPQMAEPLLIELYRQAATAVSKLHKLGVAHRDLKGENFLVSANQVILIDLGLSARYGRANFFDHQQKCVCTPLYAGPEIMVQSALTRPYFTLDQMLQSDCYSLGVVFFRAINGGYPYDGNNLRHLLYNLANNIREPEHPSYRQMGRLYSLIGSIVNGIYLTIDEIIINLK